MTATESFDAGIARQIGHYADAVRVPAGYDQILVSGTPGLAPDGSLPGDMTGQATQAWQNIETTLNQAGASLPRHRQRPAVADQCWGRPGLCRSPEQIHHPHAGLHARGGSCPGPARLSYRDRGDRRHPCWETHLRCRNCFVRLLCHDNGLPHQARASRRRSRRPGVAKCSEVLLDVRACWDKAQHWSATPG